MNYILIFIAMSFNLLFANENKDSSQIKFPNAPTVSFMLGTSYPSVNHNIDDINVESNYGLAFGIQFIQTIDSAGKSRFKIVTRGNNYFKYLGYNVSNRRIDGEDYDYLDRNLFAQISILLRYNFIEFDKNIFYALAGPYLSFSLNENNKKAYNYFAKEEYNNFGFGLGGGIGYEYKFKKFSLGIEYYYQFALNNMYKDIDIKSRTQFIHLIYTRDLFSLLN